MTYHFYEETEEPDENEELYHAQIDEIEAFKHSSLYYDDSDPYNDFLYEKLDNGD